MNDPSPISTDSSDPPDSLPTTSAPVRAAMAIFATLGLMIAGYLAFVAMTSDGVAGCGGGDGLFDCSHVLQSRWSKWLGLPVSLPAVFVYVAILATLALIGPTATAGRRRAAWGLLLILAAAAAGSAVWFIGLQLFVLKGLCVYCMSAHACSLAVATIAFCAQPFPLRRAAPIGVVGLAGVLAVAVPQLLVEPQAKTYQVERVVKPSGSETVVLRPREDDNDASANRVPTKGSRIVTVLDGRAQLDAYDYPTLGSPDAEHILVDLFDYTCHHCRTMHRHLDAARTRYGDQLGIVAIVVPMNSGCNSVIGGTHPDHKDACILARLALAVWRTAPDQFPEFHHWLIEDEHSRTAEEAHRRVVAIIGEAQLQRELDDWRIDEQLQLNVDLYRLSGLGKIPKLLFLQTVIRGETESPEELFELIERELDIEPIR